jgi:hypothetical protein
MMAHQRFASAIIKTGDFLAGTVAGMIPRNNRPVWAVRRVVDKIANKPIRQPIVASTSSAKTVRAQIHTIDCALGARRLGVHVNTEPCGKTLSTYFAARKLQKEQRVAGVTIIDCGALMISAADWPQSPNHMLAHHLQELYESPQDWSTTTVSNFFMRGRPNGSYLVVLDQFEKLTEVYSKKELGWLVRDLAHGAGMSDCHTFMVNVSDSDLAKYLLEKNHVYAL